MSSSLKKAGKGKFWQKAILFMGGGAFLLTAMLPIIGSFFNGQGDHGNTQQGSQVPTEELQELEDNLQLVLEREPNNLNALQNLVQVRINQGDLQGTIEPLEQILAQQPNDPNALQGLVWVQLQLADLEAALDPLDKLLTLFPEDEGLVQLKGQIEQDLVRSNANGTPADDSATPTPTADTAVTEETETEDIEIGETEIQETEEAIAAPEVEGDSETRPIEPAEE